LHLQAAALTGLDRLDEAEAADLAAEAALAGAPANTGTWLRTQLPAHRAEIALRRRDVAGAVNLYNSAIRQIEVTPLAGSRLEAKLFQGLARAQRRQGDRAGAEASLRRAADVLSRQTDGQLIPREEVEEYLALLAPGALAGDAAKLAEYIRVSSLAVELETARTLALVAAEFAAGEGAEAEVIKRYQQTGQDLRNANARRARTERPDSGASQEDIDFARAEADRALVAHEEATAAAQAQGGQVQAVLSQTVSLDEIQRALKPGEAYVRYLFVDDKLQAWVATRDSAKLHDLGVNEAEVDEKVALMRRGLVQFTEDSAGNRLASPRLAPFIPRRAIDLYDDLVRPLAGSLGTSQRVIIEPTGSLFSLPFAALIAEPLSEAVQARRATPTGGADYSGSSGSAASARWCSRREQARSSACAGPSRRRRPTPCSPLPIPSRRSARTPRTPRSPS
jgi:hypothetical protein